MRRSGLPLATSSSRANNTPCQTPLCPKRRPPRPQQPIFSVFHRGGLHFEHRTTTNRDLTASKRGNGTIRGPDTSATRRQLGPHAANPPERARLETNAGHTAPGWCPTAVSGGSGGAWPTFKATPITHQHTRHRRRGGRRVSCGTREAWLWGLAAVPVGGGAWMGCAQQ